MTKLKTDFSNAEELLQYCTSHELPISTVMLMREAQHTNRSELAIQERLSASWEIMEASARQAIQDPVRSMGGLIGGEARKVSLASESIHAICGSTLSKAIAYSMSVLEVNASMGLIVAAPTAGSSGVIPGALLSLQESLSLPRHSVLNGLLNAGAIGYLFMRNASVSGAEAGCQAEVGAASAMAASAVTELMGGTPGQCMEAAALAISNLLGLICDPVGGLVEVPCQSRNAMGVANAFVCAQMALSGVTHLVPLDEMLHVMHQVGSCLPKEFRETALGGNAATPTGCRCCCK